MFVLGVGTTSVATHHTSLSDSVLLPTLNTDIVGLVFTTIADLAIGGVMIPL